MGVGVGKYKVVLACYVPVGTGFRYKRPGQVVMLTADEAADLADYLEPVPDQPAEDQGVAERNTPEPETEVELVTEDGDVLATFTVTDQPVAEEVVVEEVFEGVTSDVGDPEAGDE